MYTESDREIRKNMLKSKLLACALILMLGWQALAQVPATQAPATQAPLVPAPQHKPELTKHHHKAAAVVMIVSGAALIGAGAIAFSRPCPAEERAQQISGVIGRTVTAGYCGPSFLQQHKIAVGASTTGVGAGLVVGGILLLRR